MVSTNTCKGINPRIGARSGAAHADVCLFSLMSDSLKH